MNNLNKQLKDLRKDSDPDRLFRKTLKRDLATNWSGIHGSPNFLFKRMVLIPMALLVLISTTGMGTFAYASPSVSEDHALFPIKHGIENLERMLPRSNSSRATLQARILKRRVDEGEFLKMHNRPPPPAHMEQIVKELDLSVTEFKKLKEQPIVRRKVLHKLEVERERYETLMYQRNGDLDEVRVKIDMMRTRLNESDLADEEKRALIFRFEEDHEINDKD